jgi:hypothetical protein
MTVHHRGELRLALDHAIQRVNRVPLTLRGPPESKPVFNRSDMHDHDRLGVFLQLQGSTDFTFPREKFWLGADEWSTTICFRPRVAS